MAGGNQIENMAERKIEDQWLRDIWYFGAQSSELKRGKQIRRMVLGEPVLFGRTRDGEVFAMRDICPHRLVPLSAGRQIDHNGAPVIECPYHGWRFSTNGVCKHMPSLVDGSPYDPEKVKVRYYPTHEANGIVFVYVSSNPRFSGVPDLPPPDLGIRAAKPKVVASRIFKANLDNTAYGLMDPGHVGYVHSQWWWRPRAMKLKTKEKLFVPDHHGWAMARHAPSGNSVGYRALFGNDVSTEIRFMLPGYRWEIVESGKSQLVALSCILPLTENETLFVQFTFWDNTPILNLLMPLLPSMVKTFLRQDGDIVGMQRLGMEFQKTMLWIDDLDTQSRWYLKLKKEWHNSRAENREFNNPIVPTKLTWRS